MLTGSFSHHAGGENVVKPNQTTSTKCDLSKARNHFAVASEAANASGGGEEYLLTFNVKVWRSCEASNGPLSQKLNFLAKFEKSQAQLTRSSGGKEGRVNISDGPEGVQRAALQGQGEQRVTEILHNREALTALADI
ncbi:unnamed protein product [Cyclocybe aegerita]|uniref:Uncharacterized protein n=1 Tax=Cyclocybe aegerita TaxID=1973307 RepID=A0A8S0VSV0_CYCAE|nr:unnamed protein product [Cyclocybe aegerita]